MIVLSRFVAITHSEDKVRPEGLTDCLPRPKRTTTLNSWVNLSKEARESGGNNQFHQAKREPTSKERRKMIALAV